MFKRRCRREPYKTDCDWLRYNSYSIAEISDLAPFGPHRTIERVGKIKWQGLELTEIEL